MQLLATAILVASLAISVKCSVLDLEKRQGCNRGYTLCRPDGAKELGVKTAPNDLENLYINLLDAVKSVPQAPNRKRDIQIEQRDAESGSSPDLCCESTFHTAE